jgi:hypothetical protein
MTGGRFADCRSSRLGWVNEVGGWVRATKEADLPAAGQSAIQQSAMTGGRFADCRSSRLAWVNEARGWVGSVEGLSAIEDGLFGMCVSDRYSGCC